MNLRTEKYENLTVLKFDAARKSQRALFNKGLMAAIGVYPAENVPFKFEIQNGCPSEE